MKIAICLHGYVCGKLLNEDKTQLLDEKDIDYQDLVLRICYNHLKKHILEKYDDVNIFVHSWEKKHSKKYKNIINPTDIIFEEPSYFGFEETLEDHQNKDYWLNENDFRIEPSSEYNYGRLMGKSNVYFTNLSGWYSNFKSLQLAVDFEQKNNLKFDHILSIRGDSLITKDINFTNYDKNYIHFQKKQGSNGSLTRMSGPRFVHQGYSYILNSDLLKNSRYKDIFSFNYKTSDTNNWFKFPNYRDGNIWTYGKVILEKNKFKDDLEVGMFELVRRFYFKMGITKWPIAPSDSEIKNRWERYNQYYKK